MNSVFEKALLSLLFYIPNHSFMAHDFLNQNSFSTVCGTWEPITCSLELVQLRKVHLDITEKMLTRN